VYWSQWQGSVAGARFVSDEDAVKWLLSNNYKEEKIPMDLRKLIEDVVE
jgi:hypothetical protein